MIGYDTVNADGHAIFSNRPTRFAFRKTQYTGTADFSNCHSFFGQRLRMMSSQRRNSYSVVVSPVVIVHAFASLPTRRRFRAT